MDFSGWFEAFLGGRWHTFDARNNVPRIGRVLIAKAETPLTWRSVRPSGRHAEIVPGLDRRGEGVSDPIAKARAFPCHVPLKESPPTAPKLEVIP